MATTATTGRAAGQPQVCTPSFVARERELAALQNALALPPAVVLVEGEAGIGKSRLLQEFLASPGGCQHKALVVCCPPFRWPHTLGPVVDGVRAAADGGVARLGLSDLAGALRPLFPEWAADLPPAPEPLGDATADRHRLFRALAELLSHLAVGLLVTEDAHCADDATLEFLLFLTSLQQQRISLAVSYRPEDVPPGSLLLQLTSRLPAGTTRARITIPALGVLDTAALVSSMLGGAHVSGAFAEFLHQRTDGIPLVVEESVRLLHDRADLINRDGMWHRASLDEIQVPPTVRDATLERAGRLRPPAQRALQAAAVLTDPAEEATLMAVAGLRETEVSAAAAEAVASGLLAEDNRGWLAFRHILTARAVYDAIPGPQRRKMHAAAGEALEQMSPLPVGQLARHFREGRDQERWIRYAEEAADVAIAAGDDGSAIDLLASLLIETGVPPGARARLARKLVRAAFSRRVAVDDRIREVVRALRAALSALGLNAEEQAEIRNPLGRMLLQLGEWETGYAELEQAAHHLNGNPVEAARTMIALGWPRAGPWHARVHLQWLHRGAGLVTSAMSPGDRLALTGDRANALLQLGEPAGWDVAAELPAEASDAETRLHLARAWVNIGEAAMLWGRYTEARRRFGSALEMADTDQCARLREISLITIAHLDWYTGAWQDLARRAVALADDDASDPLGRDEAILVAGLLCAAHGDRGQAEKQLCHVLGEAQRRGIVDLALAPAAMLARLRLGDGDAAGAFRLTDEPVRALTGKGIWVWATDIAPVRAEALLAVGRHEEARRFTAAFARGLQGRDAPAPRAALLMCRAVMAAPGPAPARAAAAFARAAAAWDALPRPYDALLAREQQGRCLLRAGGHDGLAVLSEVFTGLSGLGAREDARRVAHRLHEHGITVRQAHPGGRPSYGDQLSPRELEVVRLLATGRTNQEIARALILSPKTVARHVDSAMRKLTVPSRTALAVAAIGAGIVPAARPQAAAR